MLLVLLQAVSTVEENANPLADVAHPKPPTMQLAAADVRQLSSAAMALQAGCTSTTSRLQKLTDILV